MKIRANVIVSGKVQGVFFRSRTMAKAREVGVTGWVRNLPNGKVEAVFEGNEDAVETMIEFCKVGSPRALVKDVEVKREAYTGEHRNFKVI